MSEQQYHEKQEKEEEKRRQEEEKEEKGRGEKWRRDPLSAVIWALILIWAGLVLVADNMGLLGGFVRRGMPWGGWFMDAWPLILAGAGALIILEAVIRLAVPEYRRPVTGTLIFGAILLAIGLGNAVGWGGLWPLALIIIGVAVLVSSFVRRG